VGNGGHAKNEKEETAETQRSQRDRKGLFGEIVDEAFDFVGKTDGMEIDEEAGAKLAMNFNGRTNDLVR